MSVIAVSNNLRRVLWADAISCLICGLAQVAFSPSLSSLLGLPPPLLSSTGEFLLLSGTAVVFLATRKRAASPIVWLLIAGNLLWGMAAFTLLLGAPMAPTIPGKIYVVAQMLTVAVLAELQYHFSFRRSGVPLGVDATQR